MRILKLTLKKAPFEVMETGEKTLEIRRDSKWMMSRLVTKDGKGFKRYSAIEFTNGYGATRPKFYCKYLGFTFATKNYHVTYSNGLVVHVKKGNILIKCGDIVTFEIVPGI